MANTLNQQSRTQRPHTSSNLTSHIYLYTYKRRQSLCQGIVFEFFKPCPIRDVMATTTTREKIATLVHPQPGSGGRRYCARVSWIRKRVTPTIPFTTRTMFVNQSYNKGKVKRGGLGRTNGVGAIARERIAKSVSAHLYVNVANICCVKSGNTKAIEFPCGGKVDHQNRDKHFERSGL